MLVLERRDSPGGMAATSELLNWLGALQHSKLTPERLNVPFVGTLLKRTEDILAYRGGAKRLKVH